LPSRAIVFVHLYNDRSGSPKVLSQSVRALHAAGYHVETITSRHVGGFLDDVPGVRRTLFYCRSEYKLLTLICYVISQIYLFLICLTYIRRDVIFHINTMMPFGAALASWIIRKPVVYHVHETSLRPRVLKRLLRSIIRLTAFRVIFVSKYLEKQEGFPTIPCEVIYNALDMLPEFSMSSRRLIPFRVLMVCSLKRYKGVDEFIKIARHVQTVRPEISFRLILNAVRRDVDQFFTSVNIPDNVYIETRRSSLDEVYSSSSLLMNLSRPDEWVETFGLTLIEGMSYGLPVIAPPVGGPVEIVEDGVDGYLISCYEIERITNAIIMLAEDVHLYERLSQNARNHVLKYSPSKFSREIVDFYDRLRSTAN